MIRDAVVEQGVGRVLDMGPTQDEVLTIMGVLFNSTLEHVPAGMTQYAHYLDMVTKVAEHTNQAARGRLSRIASR